MELLWGKKADRKLKGEVMGHCRNHAERCKNRRVEP